jgi:hypothetical protein
VPRFPSKSGLIHEHTVKHTVKTGVHFEFRALRPINGNVNLCFRNGKEAVCKHIVKRLGGGPGEETTAATATATATATSSGSESKVCVFHLMDGDVFKLIGEACGELLMEGRGTGRRACHMCMWFAWM